MTVGIVTLLLVLVALANFSIGGYVLFRNRARPANRAFALMASTAALWSLGVASGHFGPLHLAGMQLAFAVAILIPVATLNFAENFPSRSRPSLALWICMGLSLILVVLSWTPLMIANLTVGTDGLRITYGPAHTVYGLYLTACFLGALWILYRKYKSSEGALREQLKYLLLGLSVPIAVGIGMNLMLPPLVGNSRSAKYGPLFSFVMIVTVAHAIVRHRLMDVRIVIRRGAVYLAAFALAGTLLLVMLFVSSILMPSESRMPLREIALALVVAVLFAPLKRFIQSGFDRYLSREPYDYQREIRQTSRDLNTTIELPALVGHVGCTVGRTLHPEWYAIFLQEEDVDGAFRLMLRFGGNHLPDRITLAASFLEIGNWSPTPIFRDEVRLDRIELFPDLSQLGGEVIVPLAAEARVIGFVVMGPKRSGDPYFSDDADLLSTLADQSAVAIRNAQTHQQILEAHEYMRWILATIESGVISVNARGRIRLFNRAAEAMTAGHAESLRGRPVDHLPAPLARLIAATLEDGQCRTQCELALPDGSGQMVPLMCSTSPLLGPQSTLVGAVAVVSDLSRLKELEKEKRRAEHLAAIESIASGLAHEIQNPLVAIKTFTQLLPSRGDDRSFLEKTARISDREITRIESLVRRFRNLAAPARQPMEPVDVTIPLQAVVDLLGPQMAERRIRLRQVADGSPRPILGNVSQLEQLFLNVCLNAVEAMEPEGELTVRVADLCAAGGATVLVEVCDTGSGIRDDLLPTIFNPFVTTKLRGSGLGLAICRSIADAHRATLTARNNVGRPGSTFTIEFPVSTGSTASVRA
jgi:PAS domain S-box-containing protein